MISDAGLFFGQESQTYDENYCLTIPQTVILYLKKILVSLTIILVGVCMIISFYLVSLLGIRMSRHLIWTYAVQTDNNRSQLLAQFSERKKVLKSGDGTVVSVVGVVIGYSDSELWLLSLDGIHHAKALGEESFYFWVRVCDGVTQNKLKEPGYRYTPKSINGFSDWMGKHGLGKFAEVSFPADQENRSVQTIRTAILFDGVPYVSSSDLICPK